MSVTTENHNRVARFLRSLADVEPAHKWREGLRAYADYIESAVRHIISLEIQMGQAATAIANLEGALTTARTTITHLQAQAADLQSQLTAAQANALDSADQSAIAGVDSFIAAGGGSPAPDGTLVEGVGLVPNDATSGAAQNPPTT